MAKPPEPIEQVLPQAALVLEASVKEVVAVGEKQPVRKTDEPISDKGTMGAEQTLLLDIKRVLKGTCGTSTLRVKKPIAPYALKEGSKGAFLLDMSGSEPVILGRYGPDNWQLSRVEAALKQ